MNLDEPFTLTDFEGVKGQEVEVTERQYRACVLHFLHEDELILVDLWAAKIGICVREGWEGPRDRRWSLLTLVKDFVRTSRTDEDFANLLLHFVQSRVALQQSLEFIDAEIIKRAPQLDDGTGEAG